MTAPAAAQAASSAQHSVQPADAATAVRAGGVSPTAVNSTVFCRPWMRPRRCRLPLRTASRVLTANASPFQPPAGRHAANSSPAWSAAGTRPRPGRRWRRPDPARRTPRRPRPSPTPRAAVLPPPSRRPGQRPDVAPVRDPTAAPGSYRPVLVPEPRCRHLRRRRRPIAPPSSGPGTRVRPRSLRRPALEPRPTALPAVPAGPRPDRTTGPRCRRLPPSPRSRRPAQGRDRPGSGADHGEWGC